VAAGRGAAAWNSREHAVSAHTCGSRDVRLPDRASHRAGLGCAAAGQAPHRGCREWPSTEPSPSTLLPSARLPPALACPRRHKLHSPGHKVARCASRVKIERPTLTQHLFLPQSRMTRYISRVCSSLFRSTRIANPSSAKQPSISSNIDGRRRASPSNTKATRRPSCDSAAQAAARLRDHAAGDAAGAQQRRPVRARRQVRL